MKNITLFLFLFLSISAFAQSSKPVLVDDLVPEKYKISNNYFPIIKGSYLYSIYALSTSDFISKARSLQKDINDTFTNETDTGAKALKTKDVNYFIKEVADTYRRGYGEDSVSLEEYYRLIGAKADKKQLDSAYQKAYPKKMSESDKLLLQNFIAETEENVNDEDMFKRSASYREWLESRIIKLKRTKYNEESPLGYDGEYIVQLNVINREITNPFMREYLNFDYTCSILKMVKNIEAREQAYSNFMKVVVSPYYKDEVSKVYANFRKTADNKPSPEFNFKDVNNKSVSLKDLRGKYVYIDIWATWCAPCKAEIPYLQKIEKLYHNKKISFVSISVDRMKDYEKWSTYVKSNNLGGTQLIADKDFNSDFIKDYNISAIPRFILIAPNGTIVSGNAKRPSDPELKKQLDKIL
ncbi:MULTISPECIES: TlpA family protein disulfide reductase [Sphingobacterium]|uniref:Thiol-disulfide isomerase/thioredoxin n=1 Tax=Sphingobacterium siyangense TaxID=459529 RepID=A0A562MG69_9SPHI|nr:MULTISPECIES: TlpA disulfide reductase family protein [Sphingobacterium]TWI18886.1 thiol-disulfide isomerase/thioredoxin [Sphingobacterium siyangense]